MIAAVISNKIGFDFVYASGFWMTASTYGLPDAGIATFTQMLDRVATLTRMVKAAVIADADTGYGGLLNVHHTVRGYEAVGVAAIQIEDQEFPKKCGHTPNKRVVPIIDMVEKVKVACDARLNPRETLIIARTDARQTDGLEGAIKRGLAYGEAGADIVFLEARCSRARRKCAGPARADFAADDGEHGRRRQNADPLEESGIDGHPAAANWRSFSLRMTGLAAAAAVENALRHLKAEGVSASANVWICSASTNSIR